MNEEEQNSLFLGALRSDVMLINLPKGELQTLPIVKQSSGLLLSNGATGQQGMPACPVGGMV